MVDTLVIKRKLQKLSEYLDELEAMRGISLEEYLGDFRNKRVVERLIQLIVDVAVDINTHIVVGAGKPAPSDAYTSFIEVAKLGVLTQELACEIAPSAGERNIIVHEYEVIDDVIVFQSIGQTLEMYGRYIDAVLDYLKE
ncbi:MAG TPA: DUF86 domain-containing protein [Firmicutes bacterium]|nr:DUF86 domain-containing protein [Candidatus Fermentithermobacillaceae bacterium]